MGQQKNQAFTLIPAPAFPPRIRFFPFSAILPRLDNRYHRTVPDNDSLENASSDQIQLRPEKMPAGSAMDAGDGE